MPVGLYTEKWQRQKETVNRAHKAGKVLLSIAGGRLQVYPPYDDRFAARARIIGGRWRPRTQMWTFLLVSKPLVMDAILEVFGPHAIGQWRNYTHQGTCFYCGAASTHDYCSSACRINAENDR